MDLPNPDPDSVLHVIGADSALKGRIGALFLPFGVEYDPVDTLSRGATGLFLLSYPGACDVPNHLLRGVDLIGCGPASFFDQAIAAGALDFLRTPWTEQEFLWRVSRLLPQRVCRIPGTSLVLSGQWLEGRAGRDRLSGPEACLLRELSRRQGQRLSRNLLRQVLWPHALTDGRAVDMAVSRLRAAFRKAEGMDSVVQIRSVRGIGYILE
jgi:hypothetical protein